MKETILIIGSKGFLGAHVKRHLIDYHSDIYEIKTWERNIDGNILTIDNIRLALLRHEPKIAINCAWLSTKNPRYKSDSRNFDWVSPIVNFYQTCQELGIQSFSFGTKIEENDIFQNEYVCAKRVILSTLESLDLLNSSCWIRPSFIFSLEDRRPHMLNELIKGSKIFPEALKYPDLVNDYIHINDVVDGLLFLIQNNAIGINELGSGIQLSNIEFLQKIFYQDIVSITKRLNHEIQVGHNHNSWNPRFTQEILNK